MKQKFSSSWDGDPGYSGHGPKRGAAVPVSRRAGTPVYNTKSHGPRLTSKPSGTLVHPAVLATTNNWPTIRRLYPFREGELCPHLKQCSIGRGLPPYQVASWSVQPFGHNRPGPKTGGSAPFRRGGWVPIWHKVAWAEAYLHANGILMHPGVWPQ